MHYCIVSEFLFLDSQPASGVKQVQLLRVNVAVAMVRSLLLPFSTPLQATYLIDCVFVTITWDEAKARRSKPERQMGSVESQAWFGGRGQCTLINTELVI